jgi:Chalcone isomerase-like
MKIGATNMKLTKMFLWVFMVQCLVSGGAMAASLDGMEFPETIQTQGAALVLNGLGPRLATMAKIKVYVAGLYVPAKTGDADELIRAQGPKQLLMKFQRDVSAEQSREAWTKGLEKASKKYPGITDRIPQLMGAMSDMKKGEEMSYAFTDGQVEILVRGESKAVIKGNDFSEALITVWLKFPPNKEFAQGLLGK